LLLTPQTKILKEHKYFKEKETIAKMKTVSIEARLGESN
jgi:hypothetical protein